MFGCPNRCRHCYLGTPPPFARRLTDDDLRWVVEGFRAFKRLGEAQPLFRELRVATSFREPDYSDDYRRLLELENELSDLPPGRAKYELLSVWRLARDADYAPWAYDIGLRVSQLSFFGLEKATDWAHRRRGAFRDLLLATERLLAVGIRPRWQWFLTKRIIPDLPGLLALVRDLRLRERCEALGGPFRLFLHCPAPDGEAWNLERLRPTARDVAHVSALLRESGALDILRPVGEPEGHLLHQLIGEQGPAVSVEELTAPDGFWFFVLPNFDVYSNLGELSPPWRLGNLKTDSLAAIVDALDNDRPPGLHAMFRVPVSELARRFGRPRSQRVYDPSDLKSRWVRMYLEDSRGPQPEGRQ